MVVKFNPQALLQLLITASIGSSALAIHYNNARIASFISTPRSPVLQSKSTNNGLHKSSFAPSLQSSAAFGVMHVALKAKQPTSTVEIADNGLTQALESNNLQTIVKHFKSHASSIPTLSTSQLQSIFDAVEVATAETDENTVNKRAIEDANIDRAVTFQALDRVRAQMTDVYRSLREMGELKVFGAVGRLPPSPLVQSSQSLQATPPQGPIYPTAGSKMITPTLLEQITELSMTNLTPRPTNFLLYGGAALAVLEGIISLSFGINFNLLVVSTLLLALADQLLVSGAVFETALRMFLPEMTSRITKHEAGHFLCAYVLGCPVEGVVLSTWAALQDGRFGGRSGRAVSAGTSYYDLDLSEQIAGMKPLTRESIDRFSVIVMGGIAAEAMEFGGADGGAGDEEALVRFLRSLNPRGGNAVQSWTPELIRNQARWGATQAVLLLKEYKPCYDALVDALERGGDLGKCVVAIEEAAKREGLGWLRSPMGMVLDEGEFGKWVPVDQNGNGAVVTSAFDIMNVESALQPNEKTNGVPTYGLDPITSTEEFLQKYRVAMEEKLKSIDEKLEEMDGKSN